MTPSEFAGGFGKNPEDVDPLHFCRRGTNPEDVDPLYQFNKQVFGSLVVYKPLIQYSNDRKTKTHESDQAIITITSAGQEQRLEQVKLQEE